MGWESEFPFVRQVIMACKLTFAFNIIAPAPSVRGPFSETGERVAHM